MGLGPAVEFGPVSKKETGTSAFGPISTVSSVSICGGRTNYATFIQKKISSWSLPCQFGLHKNNEYLAQFSKSGL